MPTLSTNPESPLNGRHPPKKPGNGQNAPPHAMSGTVQFTLVPDAGNGTLTLSIAEKNPSSDEDLQLVGQTKKGNRYLKVPKGKAVKIEFELAGPWDWSFRGDGVTFENYDHSKRYWLVANSNKKSRTLVIESSNAPPVLDDEDPKNDEKFNLEVDIKQSKGSPLSIIIDPITKNPPPGGGFVPVGEPGPLL